MSFFVRTTGKSPTPARRFSSSPPVYWRPYKGDQLHTILGDWLFGLLGFFRYYETMKIVPKSELDIIVEALQTYVDQEWIKLKDRECANRLLDSITFLYNDKNLLTEEERLFGTAAKKDVLNFIVEANRKEQKKSVSPPIVCGKQ